MADPRVTRTAKDSEGDITALCNENEPWSGETRTRSSTTSSLGANRSFVDEGTGRSVVQVVNGPTGKYLRPPQTAEKRTTWQTCQVADTDE